jgi:16S rRNA processing protein RimM
VKRRDDAAPAGPGAPARLTVGLVRGLRGLRGHVRLELLTDRPEERFTVGAVLYPEGSDRGLTIDEASAVADGPGWWLRFEEVPDRNAAEALRGTYLEIETPDEPREPGRWFWHELEGLAVRGSDGTELGRVVDIYRAGGAEVFVVRGPRGELDVPGVKGIVVDLAPDRGEMLVDMQALALDARPVDDDDYVRPRDRRPANPTRPKPPKPAVAGPAANAPAKKQPGSSGARTSGQREDAGTRPLSADEIAILRGTAADPAGGDAEPPSDAG